jgi:hypothetical protein
MLGRRPNSSSVATLVKHRTKAILKSHFRASLAIPHITALSVYTVIAILRASQPWAI